VSAALVAVITQLPAVTMVMTPVYALTVQMPVLPDA
jgi:hypothetical protein